MTRKHRIDWCVGVGLAAAVAFSGAAFTPATALESWVLDNGNCKMRTNFAADRKISEREAKVLARHYLRKLGFTRHGKSGLVQGAIRVEPEGEKWRVNFRYGWHLPTNKAVFFINRNDGLLGSSERTAEVTKGLVVG